MPGLIDRTSDRPVFRQIADHLRAGIRQGQYPQGAALPSETKLVEMYGVARATAREAIKVLKDEGLVRSEHGRGIFVRQRPTVHRLARNRFTRQRRETGKGAYDVEMKELGFIPTVELTELGPVTPPDEVVKRLQLESGEQVLIRRRRMYANGDPMQLAVSYVPWSLAEGTQMVERDTGSGGIYSRLAEIGHGPVRFTEDVSTRTPLPEEAEFLGLLSPQPVFYLVRVAFDAAGRPVETCDHIMSGDRWQLSYEWAAD